MFKVFSVPPTKKAQKDEVLKDDLVSRQSIAERESDALGFPGLGKVIPAGQGDELVRALRGRRPLPRDLQEVVPPEVDLLRADRHELHIASLPPRLFLHSKPPASRSRPGGITRPAARDISVPPVRHRFSPVRRSSGASSNASFKW